MNRLLRRALGRMGTQVFVEMFSGQQRVSGAITRRSGVGVVALDIKGPDGVDMCHPAVRTVLRDWCRRKLVRGIWIAFPCSTWSRARRRPLRYDWCIRGRPDLSTTERSLVQLGNRTLDCATDVVDLCVRERIPVVAENPIASQAWLDPRMLKMRSFRCCRLKTCDQCLFGAPWRKRTRLACWHAAPTDKPLLCASRAGMCDASGKPHVHLVGRVPGSSEARTKQAEGYTSSFAKFGADILCRAADTRDLIALERICMRLR